MVGLQASFSDCSIPRLCRLLLCILIFPYFCSNPCQRYHTSSSAHLGVPCLRPSIYVYHKRSFSNMVVSCHCYSMPTTHPILPLPYSSCSYCMPISPLILLLHLASCEATRVSRIFFCRLLAPPRLHPAPPSFVPSLPCTHLK